MRNVRRKERKKEIEDLGTGVSPPVLQLARRRLGIIRCHEEEKRTEQT
jgi:hypothetical protein